MTVDEQRIRDFAYQIWESEGRPDGQEERHWAMARKLAEAAEAAARSLPLKRSGKTKGAALSLDQAPSPLKGKPALCKPAQSPQPAKNPQPAKSPARKTGKTAE
ncbi:MAG TPA: DUF2934 domain-containing protein [Pseudomonas sp.]|nr:DUF2934 domain-containing protein [Pseudomonas sp.]